MDANLTLKEALDLDPNKVTAPSISAVRSVKESSVVPDKWKQNENWLDLFHNPFARISRVTSWQSGKEQLVALSDNSVQFFKGTSSSDQITSVDTEPIDICSLSLGNTYAVVLACEDRLSVIREQDKQKHSIQLPPSGLSQEERDAWEKYFETKDLSRVLGVEKYISPLTARVKQLDGEMRDRFLRALTPERVLEWKQLQIVAKMTRIKRNMQAPDALDYLIYGTENNSLVVLNLNTEIVVKSFQLSAPVVDAKAVGSWDLAHNIALCLRDKTLWLIKDQELKKVARLPSHPVALCVNSDCVYVACMNSTIRLYSSDGELMSEIQVNSAINCMCEFKIDVKSLNGVLVGMADKTIRLYEGSRVLHSLTAEEVPVDMLFGNFVGESSALAIIGDTGGLSIKILKRSASLIHQQTSTRQDVPIDLPVKTRLFLEQRKLEVQESKQMHLVFQKQLEQFRLKAATTYLQHVQSSLTTASSETGGFQLDAESIGMGPQFRIRVYLTLNGGETRRNLLLLFKYHAQGSFSERVLKLPFIVPGVRYSFHTLLNAIPTLEQIESFQLDVFLQEKAKARALSVISIEIPSVPAQIVNQ